MANITIADYGTVTTAVTGIDQTKMVETTATAVISPTFSSVSRVTSAANAPTNFNIGDLTDPPEDLEKQKEVYYMEGDHIVDCYSLEDITTNN